MSREKLTAEDALRIALRAQANLSANVSKNQRNSVIADNILRESLGQFDGHYPREYHLDKMKTDTLLAHGRQDAAHAVLNTSDILDEVGSLRGQLKFIVVSNSN